MRYAHVSPTLALLLLAPAATAQYEPVALPPLPGHTESFAFAISPAGEVVGYSSNPASGAHQAVAWDRNGNAVALPSPPFQPTTQSEARSIQASGAVAGYSGSSGLVWDRDGNPTLLLPLPGDVGSSGHAINEAGEVAGVSASEGRFSAVVWDARGNPTALPRLLPSDFESLANDIGPTGEVVGASGFKAVMWKVGAEPVPLAALAGQRNSIANRISPSGEIVGTIWRARADDSSAVVWDVDGNAFVLPPLSGDLASSGQAINAASEVAGTSLSGSRRRTPVVWDAGGNPTALPCFPGDAHGNAWDIDARGEVVGACSHAGRWLAVVWRRAPGRSH